MFEIFLSISSKHFLQNESSRNFCVKTSNIHPNMKTHTRIRIHFRICIISETSVEMSEKKVHIYFHTLTVYNGWIQLTNSSVRERRWQRDGYSNVKLLLLTVVRFGVSSMVLRTLTLGRLATYIVVFGHLYAQK